MIVQHLGNRVIGRLLSNNAEIRYPMVGGVARKMIWAYNVC